MNIPNLDSENNTDVNEQEEIPLLVNFTPVENLPSVDSEEVAEEVYPLPEGTEWVSDGKGGQRRKAG